MSFEISVSHDVSLSPARRGLRTRFRSPSEAFSYWATADARQRHVRGGEGPTPDLAGLRLHLRPTGGADDLREAARIEEAVKRVHLQEVPVVGPPDLAPAEKVEDEVVTAELRSQALFGRGSKVRARRRAHKQAAEEAAQIVTQRRARAASDRDADLAEAERNYAALVANEPAAVLGAVEASFDHDDVPAAPVASADGTVSIVVCAPAEGAIPDQQVTWARRGKPGVADRTESDRDRLSVEVLASSCLAAVRRASASAPGIREVRLVAVRPVPDRREAEAVFAGHFDVSNRERWADEGMDPVSELAAHGGDLLASTLGVRPLDLSGEPEIDRVVKEISAALYP